MKIIGYYHPIRPRNFLINNQITWSDILRQKQRRIEILNLEEQLKKAKNDPEKNSIEETILLLKSEIDQWVII